MNPAPENNPESFAKQRLSQACRAIDRSARLRWTLIVCQVLVVAFLAFALMDYWLILPVLWRTAGSLALAGVIAWGIAGWVRYRLRPTHLKQGALAIEAKRPELGCEVSTAAEYLSGEKKIEHEYESELAAALEAKTAQALVQSPVLASGTRRFAAFLLVSLLLLLALALIAPGGFTALERAAVPFSKAHYTSVQVQPGDFEVPIGSSLSITNAFSGRLPSDARFSWTEAGNLQWQTAALTTGTQGIYFHTLTNLQSDIVYHVAGNDALSPDYKITTYIPPAVKEFNVQLTYPAYTQLPGAVQKSPDITAVRATTASIVIRPNVDLAQAKLRLGSNELAMARNPDGTWTANVPLKTDSDYWISLSDRKGHSSTNDKPYHLTAVPDNPPKVEITDPGKDIRSSATNKVLVKISASDDFGVEKIKLVYNKLGGAEVTMDAQRESSHNGEIVAKVELDLSSLELKEYDVVAYHAEATDNNTLDGPGVGKSPVYFIEITDQEGSPSLAKGQGKKVNLLVIQKQIIADTTVMASNAPTDKFKEMTLRQRDAAEFGHMYLEAISDGNADAAVSEMKAALSEMELAGNQLEKQQQAQSLPHEESALAHLYQVVKLMPELQNMPTQPQPDQKPPSPKVQVVLQAIQKQRKENATDQDLQDALKQAQDLARAQADLNSAMRQQTGSQAQGQSQMQAQGEGQGQGQGQGQGEGEGQGKGNGQAQEQQPPGQQASNQAKSDKPDGAQPKGNAAGQGDQPRDTPKDPTQQAQAQEPPSPAEIAQKEEQLSDEAKKLAEQLQRIAGKDRRLGHNAGSGAAHAAANMKAAGQAARQGGFGTAGEYGFQGELEMRSVADKLERLVKNKPDASDIAHEDSPKAYDSLISEYLKRLSHAE
ncbi:MAG TPA: DUF4175 family protein [Verrucomicrobiae bacterium]|nr:DUF4175 family protein [Verrucomicrobiae bacterium]